MKRLTQTRCCGGRLLLFNSPCPLPFEAAINVNGGGPLFFVDALIKPGIMKLESIPF
jgi:hypothetical protein